MKLKEILFAFVCFLIPFAAFSQETGNTPGGLVKSNGSLLVTNNGFAPIPAFSFDKPTVIAFLSFNKGRFGYQPDVALGLDGDLWMNNHWLRYYSPETERFSFQTGINLSLFFNHITAASQETIHVNRNITWEAAGNYRISRTLNADLTYRYNYAVDPGTVSGHFIDVSGNISGIGMTSDLSLNLRPQLFYFDHIGSMDGLFTAVYASAGYKKIPVFIFFQGVRRMWSNFSPSPVFQWNTGVQYVF